MDPRYYGGSLMARSNTEGDRRSLSTKAGEDAYYKRHAPADGRVLTVTSAVAVAWLGLMTIDLLQR